MQTVKIKMKPKPLYMRVGTTIVNVAKVESLKNELPTYTEILEHIISVRKTKA